MEISKLMLVLEICFPNDADYTSLAYCPCESHGCFCDHVLFRVDYISLKHVYLYLFGWKMFILLF